jgi:hypothetical protein
MGKRFLNYLFGAIRYFTDRKITYEFENAKIKKNPKKSKASFLKLRLNTLFPKFRAGINTCF